MNFFFPPQPQPYLRIAGETSVYPVHRIYCVGRNYAAHAMEMGGDPDREAPFFFAKSPDNLVIDGGDFPYPACSEDVHHEIELVVALTQGGRGIPRENALNCVGFYGVGLDMTLRDLQAECKKHGRPWEIAKAFDRSAPCSNLRAVSEIGHPAAGAIWLDVNGARRQTGDLNQMIWKVPEIIACLSELFELFPGDLIMTGTPSGVGAVRRGDRLHGSVEGVGEVRTKVV
ncbi:MAG: fumarylacetoacetate hydrolase family protein [Rhizobiales bacterium]|nr:fumarylacetoacetate hydrolase family protein [Hyphomicrobiales bacterium]